MLVANALDRIPGDLEDASSILGGRTWDTARRVTIPLALPALLAGALVAFLQAMTLFGSPAILALPAGFHTMTTKIWSLFQYPPKPELAAAASLPLLVLTVILLRARALHARPPRLFGRWRQGRRSAADPARLAANGRRSRCALLVLLNPVFLPYGALLNAAFSRVATQLVTFEQFHAAQYRLRVLRAFGDAGSRFKQHLHSRHLGGDDRHGAGARDRLSRPRARRSRGHRALGFLATAPVAIPGIVLGVGLFLSYTRPPFVLYGTLWILLIAFVTDQPARRLSAAAIGASAPCIPSSRMRAASSARRACRRCARSPRRCLRTSVIATWCFVFVGVIRELSAAIMLFTSETKVVSVLIFDLNESGDLAAISVLGLFLLVITFAVVILANRIPGFGRRRRLRHLRRA